MKAAAGNPPPEGTAGSTTAAPFASASPDELVGFARDYFASDFPNPRRDDCPPPASLTAFARSGKLPDEGLRAHLFGCSECFREYSAALESARPAPALSWWSRLKAGLAPRKIPALATTFSLLLVCFVGALVWRNYPSKPETPSGQDGVASVKAPPAAPPNESVVPVPAVPSPEANPPAGPARTATQPPRDLLAMSTVRVDLEDYNAVRGDAEAGGGPAPPVRVSGPRTRLVLLLPGGSSRGNYEISIVDERGRHLATSTARSADGKSVTAVLNVGKLALGKYRLRVAVEGEVPGYYPIIVEGRRPAARLKSR